MSEKVAKFGLIVKLMNSFITAESEFGVIVRVKIQAVFSKLPE
jgi:hypothetical protein